LRYKRRFQFHSCFSHTLFYAHALDGGDPANEPLVVLVVEGDDNGEGETFIDAIYSQDIQSSSGAGATGSKLSLQDPIQLCRLEWRYDDINFTESGAMLIDEYR